MATGHEAALVSDRGRAALGREGKASIIITQVVVETAATLHFETIQVFAGLLSFGIVMQSKNVVPGWQDGKAGRDSNLLAELPDDPLAGQLLYSPSIY